LGVEEVYPFMKIEKKSRVMNEEKKEKYSFTLFLKIYIAMYGDFLIEIYSNYRQSGH
jgi:hypothetical protein